MNQIQVQLNLEGDLITFDEIPILELPYVDHSHCEKAWYNPDKGLYMARLTHWILTEEGWEIDTEVAGIVPEYTVFSISPIGSLSLIGVGATPAIAYKNAFS